MVSYEKRHLQRLNAQIPEICNGSVEGSNMQLLSDLHAPRSFPCEYGTLEEIYF